MNFTNRQWVWLSLMAASALVVLYYALAVEPNRVEVTHPPVPKSAVNTPVRIIQISDLHIQDMVERERLVIKQVKYGPKGCIKRDNNEKPEVNAP